MLNKFVFLEKQDMVTFKERRNYLKRDTFFMGRFLSTYLRKLRCELSADHMGLESALKLMY